MILIQKFQNFPLINRNYIVFGIFFYEVAIFFTIFKESSKNIELLLYSEK